MEKNSEYEEVNLIIGEEKPINPEIGRALFEKCSEVKTDENGEQYRIVYMDKYHALTTKDKAVSSTILKLKQ